MRERAGDRMRDMRVGTGEVDDRAAPSLAQIRPRRLATEKHDVKLAAERALPVAQMVELLDEAEGTEGAGVDQHVDAAEALGGASHQLLDLCGVGQVAWMATIDADALLAGLPDRGLRGGGVDVAAHDLRAVAREHQRTPLADAAASTRDDRDLAFQPLGQQHSGSLVLAVTTHAQVRLLLVTGEALEFA